MCSASVFIYDSYEATGAVHCTPTLDWRIANPPQDIILPYRPLTTAIARPKEAQAMRLTV